MVKLYHLTEVEKPVLVLRQPVVQSCPLSGKPDIEPTSPNDRV